MDHAFRELTTEEMGAVAGGQGLPFAGPLADLLNPVNTLVTNLLGGLLGGGGGVGGLLGAGGLLQRLVGGLGLGGL